MKQSSWAPLATTLHGWGLLTSVDEPSEALLGGDSSWLQQNQFQSDPYMQTHMAGIRLAASISSTMFFTLIYLIEVLSLLFLCPIESYHLSFIWFCMRSLNTLTFSSLKSWSANLSRWLVFGSSELASSVTRCFGVMRSFPLWPLYCRLFSVCVVWLLDWMKCIGDLLHSAWCS